MINFAYKYDGFQRQSVIQVQENERKKIAQELHDEIGQYLTAIHMDASAIIAANELQSAHVIASEIDGVTLQMMGVVKNMLHRLRSPHADMTKKTFNHLVNDWERRNKNITLSLFINDDIYSEKEEISKILYRLIQESLTNVSRHSDANHVSIILERNNKNILLLVKDDGNGFSSDTEHTSFGLLGMQERVESVSGSFLLETKPNEGVMITATIPCEQ